MLLAGGQGSRLYALTKNLAKPAVPFGGKYRIIDFTLSNCINSGIETVGILTQYQPLKLNTYIGTGQPWDLDRIGGGAYILPPYQDQKGAAWYKGTANAIYQNRHFIEEQQPEYVLVLSGDHIYKMDYSLMLDYHKKKKADCTIAVLEVPMEEASRFGIMNTNETGRIIEFSTGKLCGNIWKPTRKIPIPAMILEKISFPRCWRRIFGCTLISSRDIGRMWEPLKACGRPIWIF